MEDRYKKLRIVVYDHDVCEDIDYVHTDFFYDDFLMDIEYYYDVNKLISIKNEKMCNLLDPTRHKQFIFSQHASKNKCCDCCVIS